MELNKILNDKWSNRLDIFALQKKHGPNFLLTCLLEFGNFTRIFNRIDKACEFTCILKMHVRIRTLKMDVNLIRKNSLEKDIANQLEYTLNVSVLKPVKKKKKIEIQTRSIWWTVAC